MGQETQGIETGTMGEKLDQREKTIKYQKNIAAEDGEEITQYSLLKLMKGCLVFANKLVGIESMGAKLGICVSCTTKYHTEFSGEGVEYSWGGAKIQFHQIQISENSRRERSLPTVCETCPLKEQYIKYNKYTHIFKTSKKLYDDLLCTRHASKTNHNTDKTCHKKYGENDIITIENISVYFNCLQIENMVKVLLYHHNIINLEASYTNPVMGTGEKNPLVLDSGAIDQ